MIYIGGPANDISFLIVSLHHHYLFPIARNIYLTSNAIVALCSRTVRDPGAVEVKPSQARLRLSRIETQCVQLASAQGHKHDQVVLVNMNAQQTDGLPKSSNSHAVRVVVVNENALKQAPLNLSITRSHPVRNG